MNPKQPYSRVVVGIPLRELYTEQIVPDTVTRYTPDTEIPYQQKVRCLDRTFCGKPLPRLLYEAGPRGEEVTREWETIEIACERKMTTYFPWFPEKDRTHLLMDKGVVGLHIGEEACPKKRTVIVPGDEITKVARSVERMFFKLGVENPHIRVFLQQCER